MQPFYVSLILLQAYYAKTHNLEEFKQISKRTVEKYLGNVAATETKCNEDLSINPLGEKKCYAIAAGNQPSIIDNFPNNLKAKLDFVLHLSTTKKLPFEQLKDLSPDFALFTSDLDPNCKVVEAAHQRLSSSISSGTTYKFSEMTAKTSTITHKAKAKAKFNAPEFLLGTLNAEAKAEYKASMEEVTESNVGKTFESQRDGPCTPYAISYALECQYSNHRKVLYQDGQLVANHSVNQKLKGSHFIPNPYDNQLAFQVTGCVNL